MLHYEKLEAITPEYFLEEFNPTLKIGEQVDGEYLNLKLSEIIHLLF